MVRTLPLDSDTRPDLSRILAIAAAIAVHAFAFLLLLIPMATPPQQISTEKNPGIIFVPPKKTIVEEEIVDRTTPPVIPRTITAEPDKKVIPLQDPPVIVEGGTVASNNSTPVDPGPQVDPGPEVTGPVSVGNLAYVTATAPPYPRPEARAGIGGTVLLKVLVDIDGRPLDVVVLESSGNRNLDRSAREHVLKNWLFQPAMRDGKAVQAYGKVPVVFSMQ